MAQAPGCGHRSANLSAAVEAAAETLVIVWGRAQEALLQPVSASQLRALLVIDMAGAVNLNGLAEKLGAIPSSASRLCDRLQAAGLLTRSAGRTDRREVVLSLTPDGRNLLRTMQTTRRTDIAKVLDAMSPDDQAALLAGLEAFRTAAADH